MFKVLYAPFENNIKKAIEMYTLRTVHVAIVWESSKGVRLITASSAQTPERQRYRVDKMEAWLRELNSESLLRVKAALREIFWENTKKPAPEPFYPSFSGHGGSGVDGYW